MLSGQYKASLWSQTLIPVPGTPVGLPWHPFLNLFYVLLLLSLLVDVRFNLSVYVSSRVRWHRQSSEKEWDLLSDHGQNTLLLSCLCCHEIKIRMLPTPQRHCEGIRRARKMPSLVNCQRGTYKDSPAAAICCLGSNHTYRKSAVLLHERNDELKQTDNLLDKGKES